MAAVDWSDPCARAGALANAYYGLLSGAKAARIRYRSGDEEQEVQYVATGMTLATLKTEMEQAQRECQRLTDPTATPRRFAITPR